MKRLILVLVLFGLLMGAAGTANAATATLTWDAPTTNTDGTPCTDLAGYNVYMKIGAAGTFTKLAGTTGVIYADTFLVPNNMTVTRCYVVTAFDTANNESVYSNEVCKSFFGVDTVAPKAPGNLTIK